MESWEHAKNFHEGQYFPWVCALCYRRFFVTDASFVQHWKLQHPNINEAKDVVHATEGSHYSFLSVQQLDV